MGSIFPVKTEDFITFCENHSPVWVANHAAVGLSTAQTNDWDSEVGKLRGYLNAQVEAKQNAKNATQALKDAVAAARADGNDLLRIIRGFAGTQGDPNAVYAVAMIPPPGTPTPLPAPSAVTDIKVELDPATGSLTLKWKASQPGAGTSYIIRRKLPGEATFGFLGVSSGKKFTDETIPAGSDGVQYSIQGTRSGSNGPVTTFSVSFGAPGEGVMVSKVKLAA